MSRQGRLLHLGHPDARVPGFEIPETVAAPLSRRQIVAGFVASIGVALLAYFLEHYSRGVEDSHISLPWLTPFVLLLACIALMPFVARHWWERNYASVAVVLAIIVI